METFASSLPSQNLESGQKSPFTFELTPSNPRQTYESSQARLDPRQQLFGSKENTEEVEEFNDEDNSRTSERFTDQVTVENNSSYVGMFKQLQAEIAETKKKIDMLAHENEELRVTNTNLWNENLSMSQQIKSKSSQNNGSDAKGEKHGRETDLGSQVKITENSEQIEAELRNIKALLLQKLGTSGNYASSGENPSIPQLHFSSQLQEVPVNTGSIYGSNSQGLPPKPSKARRQSSQEVRSIAESQDLNKAQLGLTISRPPSTSSGKLPDSKRMRQSLNQASNPDSHTKLESGDGQSLVAIIPDFPGHSSASLQYYHKWREILSTEWGFLQKSLNKLEQDRSVLKKRRQSVQQYEWEMLWELKNNFSRVAEKKVVEGIKHEIFNYELEAEKCSILETLAEKRFAMLKNIDSSLRLAMKKKKMNSKVDQYLCNLFDRYILMVDQFESKRVICTASLVPYSKYHKSALKSNPHQLASQKTTQTKLLTTQWIAEPKMSKNLDTSAVKKEAEDHSFQALKATFIKFKESGGGLRESGALDEINNFFENQQAWFDMIRKKISIVASRLVNPTTLSSLY